MSKIDEITHALASVQECIEVLASSRPVVIKSPEGCSLVSVKTQLIDLLELRDRATLELFDMLPDDGWAT